MAVSLALLPASARGQVQVKTGAAELRVSGRLQFQAETTTCTRVVPDADSLCEGEEPGLNLFMRRARFSIEARIDDRLTMKVEPDFDDVDGVSLKDAWGRFAFTPDVSIQAGHFNRPFDGFHLTSSTVLPVERAVIVPGVSSDMLPSYSGLTRDFELSDRDIGIMLQGSLADEVFSWWLGVFTGASDSRGEDTNTQKQFIGRAQVALEAGGMPLEIAGAVALTDAPYTTLGGETEAEHFTNVELYAQLGGYADPGLTVQAGLVLGANPTINDAGGPIDIAGGDDFGSLRTWQGIASYRIDVENVDWLEGVAPLVRVSHGDPDTDRADDEVWGFTPGLVLYFYRRNRLTLTWDVASFAAPGTRSENSFRAQMQFHF